jgi:hypothetical protein
MHTPRILVYEIPRLRLAAPSRFFMAFSPCQWSPRKGTGEIAMTHMVEGSKVGRNSVFVLAVGIMSAFIIALMLLIGIAGKNTTPNTAQLTTEATR